MKTTEEIRAIRYLYRTGARKARLAEHFELSRGPISAIISRKNYQEVSDSPLTKDSPEVKRYNEWLKTRIVRVARGNPVLDHNTVASILYLCHNNLGKIKEVAEHFNTSKQTVRSIIARKSRTEVRMPVSPPAAAILFVKSHDPH